MGKEALFNILNNRLDFDDAIALDLFAGTGNISYELGSRGCASVTSVDADSGCVKFIRKTAESLELPISVIQSNAYTFLEKASGSYDLIFADPPYGADEKDFHKIAQLVFDKNMLVDGGLLVIEHSKYTDFENFENLLMTRNYGGSHFSFFGIENDEEEDSSED